MDRWIISSTADLQKPVQTHTRTDALMFPGDAGAHVLQVTLMNGGAVADLSGATVHAYFKRDDGQTVVAAGVIQHNVAYVTMPQEAYAVPGQVRCVVRLTLGSQHQSIAAWFFSVGRKFGEVPIVPGNPVQDLEDLLTYIDQLEQLRVGLSAYSVEMNAVKAVNREQQHRLDNLEAAAAGVLYRVTTDTAVGAVKRVLPGTMPWATLDRLGGTSAGVLSAHVKSTGKNVLNLDQLKQVALQSGTLRWAVPFHADADMVATGIPNGSIYCNTYHYDPVTNTVTSGNTQMITSTTSTAVHCAAGDWYVIVVTASTQSTAYSAFQQMQIQLEYGDTTTTYEPWGIVTDLDLTDLIQHYFPSGMGVEDYLDFEHKKAVHGENAEDMTEAFEPFLNVTQNGWLVFSEALPNQQTFIVKVSE